MRSCVRASLTICRLKKVSSFGIYVLSSQISPWTKEKGWRSRLLVILKQNLFQDINSLITFKLEQSSSQSSKAVSCVVQYPL